MKRIITLIALTAFSAFSCTGKAPAAVSENEQPEATASKTQETTEPKTERSGEDIILTMPVMVAHRFSFGGRDLVQEFNDADNGYKIVLKDYAEGFDPEEQLYFPENAALDWDRELTLDVMKGGILDIIPECFLDHGKYHNLAEKGAFADLNTFIDSDDTIDRKELWGNVLEACEINGELRYMPICFDINTLAGPTRYVGSKTNWTFDEMKERWEKMPEGATINGHTTKSYVYFALLRENLSSFIDYDKAQCSFDSDRFISMLEFLDSFKDDTGYKEEIDFESPEFLREYRISGFMHFHRLFWRDKVEDLTFVGYPSDDGCGSFFDVAIERIAVSALSSPEKQRGAWEFVRMLISYDCQYGNGFTGYNGTDTEFALPINKKAFEDMGRDQYSHEGEIITDPYSGEEIKDQYLTKAEYDILVKLTEDTRKVNVEMERDIYEIINDEIIAMFWHEKTSREVADNIQSRVQLLVSERC